MAISSMTGENKINRQPKSHTRHTSGGRSQLGRQIFESVRKTFIFLFVLTVIVYATAHRSQVEGYTLQITHKLTAKVGDHGFLRQTALNHEDEVDQVITK